jgi:protein-disulfide isomerase
MPSMLSRIHAALLILGVLGAGVSRAQAQEEQSLTPRQQDMVRKLIHDYLVENPSVIAEAIDALREKEQLASETAAKKALIERHDQIVNDPEAPVLGNPKGDVTVVEFFDYRCPYCKAAMDSVFDTVKADGKVRLVMKEWPVLGPDSIVAARAALASRNQKRYEEFHRALMHIKGPLNDQAIFHAAADAGLNVERLKKDMEDEHIDAVLKANMELAHVLNLTGTPSFVVGDQEVSSALTPPQLKQLIDQARKSKG